VAISTTVTRAKYYRTECRLAIVEVATNARHDVSRSVCVLVTNEVPFGGTRVGPRNHYWIL